MMGTTSRALRLLTAILAVWCLGCDAFEAVAEWLVEAPATVTGSTSQDEYGAAAPSVDRATVEAADACRCVLGHAAVLSADCVVGGPAIAAADFVDGPPALVLAAPEPLLRPPVA